MNKTRISRQASSVSEQMSFLPNADFNPIWPSKHTLVYQALCLMLKGEKISHLSFQKKTNSYRLAAYIYELIKLGWPIKTDHISLPGKKWRNNRHYCRYFFSKDIIAKAQEIIGGAL